MLYDYNYITFWKRQNYNDSSKSSGCQKLGWDKGGGGGKAREQRER